jgi:hypothetical protein
VKENYIPHSQIERERERDRKREREKEPGPHNPLQGHSSSDLKTSTRPHLLNVPLPLNSTSLGPNQNTWAFGGNV